jgi:hypothetical protein
MLSVNKENLVILAYAGMTNQRAVANFKSFELINTDM